MKRLQNFSIVLGIALRDHRLDQCVVKIEVSGGRVLEAYNVKIEGVKKRTGLRGAPMTKEMVEWTRINDNAEGHRRPSAL